MTIPHLESTIDKVNPLRSELWGDRPDDPTNSVISTDWLPLFSDVHHKKDQPMLLQHPQPYSRHNPQITDKMPAIRDFNTSTNQNNALPALGTRDWRPPLYWNNLLETEEEKFDQKCKKIFIRAMVSSILIAIYLLTAIFLIKLIILVIWLK